MHLKDAIFAIRPERNAEVFFFNRRQARERYDTNLECSMLRSETISGVTLVHHIAAQHVLGPTDHGVALVQQTIVSVQM